MKLTGEVRLTAFAVAKNDTDLLGQLAASI
jgi:hypothetical protein